MVYVFPCVLPTAEDSLSFSHILVMEEIWAFPHILVRAEDGLDVPCLLVVAENGSFSPISL
jgi:hypothetical protein